MALLVWQKYTGTKRTALVKENLKLAILRLTIHNINEVRLDMQFALCTNNSGYMAALEIGKVYATIPDAEAAGLCFC